MIINKLDLTSDCPLMNVISMLWKYNSEYYLGNRKARLDILEEYLREYGCQIERVYEDGSIIDYSFHFKDDAAYTFFLLKWS
jgi:hypothetical protein